ncbi:MAG: glycosyltransferase [Bacteroidota bacterium]|nr:glycosyltransferase [Bacteroidota bacterium]
MPEHRINVGIITHNHQNMIKKCIESVFMQKNSDQFQVIVIDDASTDENLEILKKLQAKYNFKLIRNSKNLGIIKTASLLHQEIDTDYFTWLDGDDYWTYQDKIKTQIDFLDQHPEYNGCFHDAEIIHESEFDENNVHRSQSIHKFYSQFNLYKTDIFPEDILQRMILPTASLVLRNESLPIFPKFLELPHSLAWVLHLESIKHSKFYYFNERWSVYRDHPQGHSKKNSIIEFKLHHINILERYLQDNYYQAFKFHIFKSIASEYRNIIHASDHEDIGKQQLTKFVKGYKTFQKRALREEIKTFKQKLK